MVPSATSMTDSMRLIVVVDRSIVIPFVSSFAGHYTAFVGTVKTGNPYGIARVHCMVERSLESPNCIRIRLV